MQSSRRCRCSPGSGVVDGHVINMRAWLEPLDGHGVAIARAGARVCDVNRRLNSIPAPTQLGQIDTTHSKKSAMFDRARARRN